MEMSGPQYDHLKFIAQILLPGVGALYFALASIWGLPSAEQVVGTITAVDVFLGLILKQSSDKYEKIKDGSVAVDLTTGQTAVTLDPQAVVDKDEVTLKVAK